MISIQMTDIFNSAYLNRLLKLACLFLCILVSSRFFFTALALQIEHLYSYGNSIKNLLLQLTHIVAYFIIMSSSVSFSSVESPTDSTVEFSSFFGFASLVVVMSHRLILLLFVFL